jgi:putative DNA primase/helicase
MQNPDKISGKPFAEQPEWYREWAAEQIERPSLSPTAEAHPSRFKRDVGKAGGGVTSKSAALRKMKMTSDYRQKPDGIWYVPKGEGSVSIRICGSLEVVAQTRDDAGASWGRLLEWPDGDARQHQWAMPMSMLAGDGGEIRAYLLDRGCYISPTSTGRAKFLDFLATTTVDARALAVSKVGWIGGVFVLPDQTIGDTPAQRVIYQATDASDHPYRRAGDVEEWKFNVARYGIGNSRIAVSLAAAFVGPLLHLIGEEGGGLHLRGPSSIGKSTALFAAASVWGPPAYVRQWRSTANGLEGVCVQHNQTLLCLDELAQLDGREAGHVAYLIANGMGKSRAGRSGALRSSAQWKVMFLSSGEISLADLASRDARGTKRSAAGQEIRILDCEADAGAGLGLFETLHDAASAEALARQIKEGAAATYGTAGPAFIERLIARAQDLAPSLQEGIATFSAMQVPAGANGQVARAARRFGLIAAAGEVAVDLAILPWPKGEATAACAAMFQQWLMGRGGAGASEDRDAIAKVRGFLEMHGASRFEPFENEEEVRISNRAGFWRDNEHGREYLFLAETWKAEVCAGMDASRVAKVLAEHKLLRRDSGGKNSISVTLPAGIGKTRCYVVNAAIFEGEA